MLVVSRRPNEKIVFPDISATVQVVAVKANVVRLGIDAPRDVAVFREEIMERKAREALAPGPPGADLADLRRRLKDRLREAAVGLAVAGPGQPAEWVAAAEAALAQIDQKLRAVEERLAGFAGAPTHRPAKLSRARRALVVEDDANERELLAGFLRMAGIDVATAGDGADALEYLHKHRPDAVLLDMILPRCDGPTTLRTIRHDPDLRGLRIFGVSGHLPEEFGLERGPAGIDRWFQKPLDPQVLLAELNSDVCACA
jgi:carbon storage regulator CsrA